jgi:DNA-binding transcriptional LysR family regulator
MLDLNQVRMFVQVVRSRSFAAAARRLGMPANTLSRHVRQLEESLDTRLMQRSTRKLTLTDSGSSLYERCADAVDDVLEAGRKAAGGNTVPSGTVRIAAPADFPDLFSMHWLTEFLARYPKVRLDFVLSDSRADLIGESIDVAFRGGAIEEPRNTYRRLATQHFKLVASPGYLELRGVPADLQALTDHDCLTAGRPSSASWVLTGPLGTEEVKVAGRVGANTARALMQSCLAGLGIALLPHMLIMEDITAGRLVHVLPAYRRAGTDFCVLLPTREQIPAAVAAFVAFAAEKLESLSVSEESPTVRVKRAPRKRAPATRVLPNRAPSMIRPTKRGPPTRVLQQRATR